MPARLYVPEISGASFILCATQTPSNDIGTGGPIGRACNAGLAAANSTTLVLPPAITFTTQPTTVGIGTQLSWSGGPGGVNVVVISDSVAGDPVITLVTTLASATVPDLVPYGVSLPSAKAYQVAVYGVAPFATIDSAASPAGFDEMLIALQYDHGPSATGQSSASGPVSVTTQ